MINYRLGDTDTKARGVWYILPENYTRRCFGTSKVFKYRNLYKLLIISDSKTRGVLYIKSLPESYRLCFSSRTLEHQRCWSTETYIN